ncbi:hypothetical protein SAMN04488542_103204 [Fontibacillus panacisegetis]|uniref:Lipoprotein n=1 Tax=Fontibacillus panacisegetis TaxID=670482 RepID=A0A1G7GUD1_9BACL|nr:hypothetical protein [Fontibacillus panacisegetis]SDE91778.1 hypothetical protein SAMN04488542_103204 [Fontibacillus panacisegetis]
MEKFTISIAVLVFVVVVGCSQKEDSQKDNNPTKESMSNIEASVELPEQSEAERLSELVNKQFAIQGDQISKNDYASMEDFGKAFINLYTGAVAEQEAVSFEHYIANENLLTFTNKMLALEQQQELKGGIGVIFGMDNEFKEVELNKLEDNLYYVNLTFTNQGSGMNCKLLVQSVNKSLKIVDLYFGNKDGVDTIATGHPSERKLDNPNLWDDPKWVDAVMEKLEKYEALS